MQHLSTASLVSARQMSPEGVGGRRDPDARAGNHLDLGLDSTVRSTAGTSLSSSLTVRAARLSQSSGCP
eukprot:1099785-Prymnesium_polylepis.1